jgi:hypothetical protein
MLGDRGTIGSLMLSCKSFHLSTQREIRTWGWERTFEAEFGRKPSMSLPNKTMGGVDLEDLHEFYFDVNPPSADGAGAEPSDNAPGENGLLVNLMTSEDGSMYKGLSGEPDDVAFEDAPFLYDPTHYDIAVALEGLVTKKDALFKMWHDAKPNESPPVLPRLVRCSNYGDEGGEFWDDRLVYC